MIGILGGTFDPIHTAHIELALSVQKHFGLKKLYLIPCNIPPHRELPEASALDRLKMVQLAAQAHPQLTVDDREIQRGGTSYAIDTLKSIRAEIGPQESLALILGADAFNAFDHWKAFEEILSFCHLIVVNRANYKPNYSSTLKNILKKHQTDSEAVLNTQPAGALFFQESTLPAISSSQVREALHSLKNRPSPEELDESVRHYIKQHQLYRKMMSLEALNQLILKTLDEAKAHDISYIDVSSMTDICESIFICTATSRPHAQSISHKLCEAAKAHGTRPLGSEQDDEGSWVLLDLNRAVIHIMLSDARQFYNLEQLWDMADHCREKHAY